MIFPNTLVTFTFLLGNLGTIAGTTTTVRGATHEEMAGMKPATRYLGGNGWKKNGNKGCSDAVQLAKSVAGLTSDVVCELFQTFDNIGHDKNGASTLCDDFESLNIYLCPLDNDLGAICNHHHSELNPAVEHNFCEPVFSDMDDGTKKDECVSMCISYVSKAEADCCAFDCA